MSPYGRKNTMLFHYTTAETAFEHIVPTGQLRLGRYEAMRDPMEAKEWRFTFEFEGGGTGGPPFAAIEPGLLKALNAVRMRTRLLSMTQDAKGYRPHAEQPFGRGYARPRMWEHYGDVHRGLCLCFDRAAFVAAADEVATAVSPVRYTRGALATSAARHVTLPDYWASVPARLEELLARGGAGAEEIAQLTEELSDEVVEKLSQAIVEHVVNHARDLLLLKTVDWATEHELRVLAFSTLDGDLFVDFGDSLKAVIVGDRFPEWQLPAAAVAARSASAELLQLTWPGGVPTPVSV